MQADRRQHQRLALRLPLECRMAGVVQPFRSCTRDISTGGVFFELDVPEQTPRPQVGSAVQIDVIVPPGPGHSPYDVQILAAAEVVRCDRLGDGRGSGDRLGIAARFKQPLQLRF
ncbi:MAG TPA: PilZ domain-containing protein [Phycisphaerae bacterium]|nr:PilZ domain-containing protein [Phycisphaerae bacterium]